MSDSPMKDESKILDQKQSGYPMDVRAVWMSDPGYKRKIMHVCGCGLRCLKWLRWEKIKSLDSLRIAAGVEGPFWTETAKL